MVYSWCGK